MLPTTPVAAPERRHSWRSALAAPAIAMTNKQTENMRPTPMSLPNALEAEDSRADRIVIPSRLREIAAVPRLRAARVICHERRAQAHDDVDTGTDGASQVITS